MRIINLFLLKNTILIKRNMSNITSKVNKKIAVCQMTAIGDKAANLNVISNLVSEASKNNVEMIFFPEACDFIFDNKKDMLINSEPILGGPTVNSYRELASKHNVWLSMGGLHEKDETNPTKIFNTHIIISNKGDIVQTYRKLHLFDVEIPEKNVRLKESDFAASGANIVTPVDTPIGRVGMAICYDMRFPEMSTQLAMIGADILTFPSAFTHATGEAHWEILLRSRAIENQCYVIAAAQVGEHNKKRRSYGHAMCVDPWGKVLVDCGETTKPCFKVAEIDLNKLIDVRRNMPVLQHRRSNVYSLYCLSLRNKKLREHDEVQLQMSDAAADSFKGHVGASYVFGHIKVPETCVFYKSDLTYAFVNLRCVTPGHVLVAPIRVAVRNKDLTEDEATDFYRTVRLIQKLMEKVHNTESCTVTIQDGVDAGQTVKHLHCHIMPRKKGDFIQNDLIYLELAKHDQLSSGHPTKPARTLQEMVSEAELLRNQLNVVFAQDSYVT